MKQLLNLLLNNMKLKEKWRNDMGEFDWYVNLMNFLDERAKESRLLNRVEITQLNNCVDRYDLANNVKELIHDIADANDCGECNSWNELIAALHQLFITGERIAI